MKLPKGMLKFLAQEEKDFSKASHIKYPDDRDVSMWKCLRMVYSYYKTFGKDK